MKKKRWLFAGLMLFAASLGAQSSKQVFDLPSVIFNQSRTISVSLPANYRAYPNRKYIVVYLFDAQSDAFFNYVSATIDYLSDLGYIQPLILVGVSSRDRQFEFTPPALTEVGKKNFARSGGAEVLSQHLMKELFPEIRKRYRCYPYSIGIGHSLGGTFVTYMFYAHPEFFNASIVISPNYDYDSMQVVHRLSDAIRPAARINKFFFLAHGKSDNYEEKFKPGIKRLKDSLGVRNIPGLNWQVLDMDNDNHGTTAPEGILKGMLALYKQFILPYDTMMAMANDSSIVFIEKLKKYYATQSSWAGIPLPLCEDINGIAYNLYYSARKNEAIAVLEWALSMYPDDSNLYDSMGELQQNSGNNEIASDFFKKGKELVVSQKSKLDTATYKRLINGFNDRIRSTLKSK